MEPDPQLAAVFRRVLPEAVDEVIASLGRHVPEYARPLEGSFGRGVRVGVTRALERFVDLVEDPARDVEADRRVYLELGRGEVRQGRTMEALLGAYRAGARIAWERFAAAALDHGVPADRVASLAADVFAYIDELSAESAEGYALEQAEREGERRQRRARLAALLVRTPPAEEAMVQAAATEAGWELPARLAVVALDHEQPERLAGRLGPGVLGATIAEGGVLVLPDPDAPGLRARLEAALDDRRAGLGPSLPWQEAAASFTRATAALRLPGDGLVVAGEHLLDLVLHADESLARDLASGALAPLAGLRDSERERLAETLHAWLEHDRQPSRAGQALGVHPHTVRYRLRRARALFGPALDEPARRLELHAALRLATREPARGPRSSPG
jgi:hypothetical protein